MNKQKNAMMDKYREIEASFKVEGPAVLARLAVQLVYRYFNNETISEEVLLKEFKKIPAYPFVLAVFRDLLEEKETVRAVSLDYIMAKATDKTHGVGPNAYIGTLNFYKLLCVKKGIPFDVPYSPTGSQAEENYFMALLYLLVMNDTHYLEIV